MPALAKSSVGSSSGTTLELGPKVWPCFLQKKSVNCWRISFAVNIAGIITWIVRPRYKGNNQWITVSLPLGDSKRSKHDEHELEQQTREQQYDGQEKIADEQKQQERAYDGV